MNGLCARGLTCIGLGAVGKAARVRRWGATGSRPGAEPGCAEPNRLERVDRWQLEAQRRWLAPPAFSTPGPPPSVCYYYPPSPSSPCLWRGALCGDAIAVSNLQLGGKKIALGGGGGHGGPFSQPPPSLLGRRDGRGVSGRGRPTCRAGGGGGVNPTSVAQNDTHVALIVLTTQMGGGGGNYWWKKLLRAKITSQRLLDQSQAGVYRGKRHIPPHFGLFGPIRVPYPKGLNC